MGAALSKVDVSDRCRMLDLTACCHTAFARWRRIRCGFRARLALLACSDTAMARMTTIYDVARTAGVGIASVSRVINDSGPVRDATRAKVLAAIRELDYRPNRAARHLAARGADRPRVAVLQPFFTANFYFQVARSIARGLQAEGIDLVLYDVASRADKNRLLDRLLTERSVEGLILVSIGIGDERQVQCERLGMPVVVVDRDVPGLPCITVDNAWGAGLALQQLQRCGCRCFGLLGGPAAAQALRQREEAFLRAVPAAVMVRAASVEAEAGAVAMVELLDRAPELDGLFAVNDLLAIGALSSLREGGRRVPEEVQVIGFDDQPLMRHFGLTTVRQPIARYGDWAVRSLLARLRGEAVASARLPLRLMERQTTRAT